MPVSGKEFVAMHYTQNDSSGLALCMYLYANLAIKYLALRNP